MRRRRGYVIAASPSIVDVNSTQWNGAKYGILYAIISTVTLNLAFTFFSIHWGVYSTPAFVSTASKLILDVFTLNCAQAPPSQYAEWYECVQSHPHHSG
jgi:hypothetical protein